MSRRTPGPWSLASYNLDTLSVVAGERSICDIVGDMPVDLENARFIVRACNAHDELVAALKILLPGLVLDLRYADDDDDKDAMRARIDTVAAALARAESQP